MESSALKNCKQSWFGWKLSKLGEYSLKNKTENQFKTTFSNGKHFVNVCTVGELKAVLAELDDELTIEQGFSDSVDVMLFCNSHGEPHLAFEDGDSN